MMYQISDICIVMTGNQRGAVHECGPEVYAISQSLYGNTRHDRAMGRETNQCLVVVICILTEPAREDLPGHGAGASILTEPVIVWEELLGRASLNKEMHAVFLVR